MSQKKLVYLKKEQNRLSNSQVLKTKTAGWRKHHELLGQLTHAQEKWLNSVCRSTDCGKACSSNTDCGQAYLLSENANIGTFNSIWVEFSTGCAGKERHLLWPAAGAHTILVTSHVNKGFSIATSLTLSASDINVQIVHQTKLPRNPSAETRTLKQQHKGPGTLSQFLVHQSAGQTPMTAHAHWTQRTISPVEMYVCSVIHLRLTLTGLKRYHLICSITSNICIRAVTGSALTETVPK